MTSGEALATISNTEEDFFSLLQRMYVTKYTGTLILHLHNGTPKVAELQAVQVRLITTRRLDISSNLIDASATSRPHRR